MINQSTATQTAQETALDYFIQETISCCNLTLKSMSMLERFKESSYYKRSFKILGYEDSTETILVNIISKDRDFLNSLKAEDCVRVKVQICQRVADGHGKGMEIFAYLLPKNAKTTARLFFTRHRMNAKKRRRGYQPFSLENMFVTVQDH